MLCSFRNAYTIRANWAKEMWWRLRLLRLFRLRKWSKENGETKNPFEPDTFTKYKNVLIKETQPIISTLSAGKRCSVCVRVWEVKQGKNAKDFCAYPKIKTCLIWWRLDGLIACVHAWLWMWSSVFICLLLLLLMLLSTLSLFFFALPFYILHLWTWRIFNSTILKPNRHNHHIL